MLLAPDKAGFLRKLQKSVTLHFSTVRIQDIERRHECVHQRAERHGTRGQVKQLHLINVARHLVDKDSFIKDHAIDMRACARIIDNSISAQKVQHHLASEHRHVR